MDHAAAANVDADVADNGALIGFEIDQVAHGKGTHIRNIVPAGNIGIARGTESAGSNARIFQAIIDEAGAVIRIWPTGTVGVGLTHL